MNGDVKYWLTRRTVASALVGVVALGFLLLLPGRDIAARPSSEHGSISGAARVIDGDTIAIEGRSIRLEGIDAPEHGQTCGRRFFGTWKCGAAAAAALADLIAGRVVTCESRSNDKYGRMLGICFVDGDDISAKMVREGFAWAFVKYSQSYAREEAAARASRAGIWTGEAEPAWVYREKRWAGAEQGAPNGCAIKGNLTAYGRIYYMPWSPRYAMVKIEEQKGEHWFCNEAEAVAAGWRPAATP
ncbi:MAG: thermonuclease family protein [Hyphomicrobium sp.]